MAAGDIRFSVRAELVERMAGHAALVGVQVEHGWPGDTLELQSVWLADSDGEMQIPHFHGQATTANPITVDDVFTVPVEIQAGLPGRTMREAEERCQEITQAVEAVVRILPTLDSLDGLLWAVPNRMRGPVTVLTKQGPVCFARIEIQAHARMTGVP